ncbi:hypothetical protein Tco_1404548 [Tanacetum coccineum]
MKHCKGSIQRDNVRTFDDDKAQRRKTKKKGKQDSPKPPPGSPPLPPPPPPPPSGASGASSTTRASDSAQAPPPPPPSSSTHQGDQSTGLGRDHIPTSTGGAEPGGNPTSLKTYYWPLQRPASDYIPHLNLPFIQNLKVFHHDVIHSNSKGKCHKLLTDQVDDAILSTTRQQPPSTRRRNESMTLQLCMLSSHWWFQRQRFYIDLISSEGDRRQKDFKHMYPSDNLEDLYVLNLQGHLNHLSPEDKKILTTAVNLWTRNLVIRHRVEDFQLGIESYQTQLNLTNPQWEATGFD